MRYTGEYGGRVLRAFKADVPYIVGALIAPEVAMTWPVANRKALENQHKVEWFGPPVDEVPQKPAPKGTQKVEADDEELEESSKETSDVDEDAEESEQSEEAAAPAPSKLAKKKGARRKKADKK